MTLALTVINPGLLYVGTAMASIPIIIHLLNRLRFKRVVWAAMEFLLAAHRKNARRVKIEQIILLIIRTLILVLLALAVARPILEGVLGALGSSRVHRVLVIDDSYSMGAQAGVSGGKTSMKQATDAALSLLGTFKKSDGLSLVLAGTKKHVRFRDASARPEEVQAAIEKLQASDSATDMVGALEEVKGILSQSQMERKVVYILTDNTRRAWQDETGKALRGLMSSISDMASVMVVDFGRAEQANLSLEEFSADRAVVTEDVLSYFTLRVKNHGSTPAENVVANVTVGGEQAQPVSFGRVESGKEVSRKWTHRFEAAEDYQIEARLKEMPGGMGDSVSVDSRRYLSVSVKKSLNVLLVDGKPGVKAEDNETFYLQMALDPRTRDQDRETIFAPTWVRDSEFDNGAMNGMDVIILANVSTLNASQQADVRQFIRDGGSLVVFLGDQVQKDAYNNQFYEDGKGFLPAFLAGTLGTTEANKPEKYTSFDPGYFGHPALREFQNEGKTGGLDQVQVAKYFQLKLPPDSGADTKVVLRLRDGNPGVVEKQFGRGKVVLVATTADLDWSNLMRLPGGLQLLHELMDYLTPDVLWRFNCLVDSESELPIAAGKGREDVRLGRPQHGGELTLRPQMQTDNRFSLKIEELTQSGFYTLSGAGLTGRVIAVNVDPRESDLTHLTKNELVEQVGQAPIAYMVGQSGLESALAAQEAAGGWARNLLYAMLCLVFAETFLAWFFNRGA